MRGLHGPGNVGKDGNGFGAQWLGMQIGNGQIPGTHGGGQSSAIGMIGEVMHGRQPQPQLHLCFR
jgi:hypothetical protein